MGNNTREELQEARNEKNANYKDFENEGHGSEDKYFDKSANAWWRSLSDEERDSIETYTGSSYDRINEYLRKGKLGSHQDEEVEQLVKYAGSGLNQFKLDTNLKLYRQSGASLFSELTHLPHLTAANVNEWVKAMKGYIGSVVTDKGFTSTSTRDNIWGGRVHMEIQAPKGTKGAYVRPFSQHMSEMEFLLNHGTKFKIVGCRVGKNQYGIPVPVVIMKIVKR